MLENPSKRKPELIAHRGFAQRYPENTRIALRAALEAGARFVEFDVQLTADGVPVLLHDAELTRTAGIQGNVLDMTLRELIGVRVAEPNRFGDSYQEPVPLLEDIVHLLGAWPDATAFVEIKRASLRRFGIAQVLERVMRCLEPIIDRCAVISFEYHAVLKARQLGARAIGWVIDTWHDRVRDAAAKLAPQYLFVDHELLPPAPQPLWEGPWRWAVYEVVDPALALELARRGVDFVETMAIGPMLADERLRNPSVVA
ncbi:MAG: glycerophosphodiester phosphodiesterase family protein [Gammaproteobacteria bacterium]